MSENIEKQENGKIEYGIRLNPVCIKCGTRLNGVSERLQKAVVFDWRCACGTLNEVTVHTTVTYTTTEESILEGT